MGTIKPNGFEMMRYDGKKSSEENKEAFYQQDKLEREKIVDRDHEEALAIDRQNQELSDQEKMEGIRKEMQGGRTENAVEKKSPLEASAEFLRKSWDEASEKLKQASGLEISDKKKFVESMGWLASMTASHVIAEFGGRLGGGPAFWLEGHLMLDAFVLSPFIFEGIKTGMESIKINKGGNKGRTLAEASGGFFENLKRRFNM